MKGRGGGVWCKDESFTNAAVLNGTSMLALLQTRLEDIQASQFNDSSVPIKLPFSQYR